MIALVDFLEARLAEDEHHARAAGWHRWEVDEMTTIVATGNGKIVAGVDRDYDARFIARHDPARVLREVEAKRKAIETHRWHGPDGCSEDRFCPLLTSMAAVWSNHPDYNQEWTP